MRKCIFIYHKCSCKYSSLLCTHVSESHINMYLYMYVSKSHMYLCTCVCILGIDHRHSVHTQCEFPPFRPQTRQPLPLKRTRRQDRRFRVSPPRPPLLTGSLFFPPLLLSSISRSSHLRHSDPWPIQYTHARARTHTHTHTHAHMYYMSRLVVENGEWEDEEGDKRYLAPELLQGRADFKSDIFSAGLIIYQVCS